MASSGGTWALNILFGIRNLRFLEAFGPTRWLELALRHHPGFNLSESRLVVRM